MPYLLFFLFLLPALSLHAAPLGEVRTEINREKTYWVGQRIPVQLDILTTAYSFSNQQFNLPAIEGGMLLQTDSSSLKLTEQKAGQQWQILRYELSLFMQRAGKVEIPSFEVTFGASAGYGQPTTTFNLKTKAISLTAKLPPGADVTQPVVSTGELKIKEIWNPDQNNFVVGDAITRTLQIQAEDISAIALPAMPAVQMDGVEILGKSADVRDKSNRGSLTGTRIEEVSYLFLQAGKYQIPEWHISWWNPKTQKLEQHKFSTRTFEVEAGSLDNKSLATDIFDNKRNTWLYQIVTMIALIVLLVIAIKWLPPRWQARRARYLISEKALYKKARSACQANNPASTYQTVLKWLSTAETTRSKAFDQQWADVQLALLSADKSWTGNMLAETLAQMRQQMKKRQDRNKQLLPGKLNPQ